LEALHAILVVRPKDNLEPGEPQPIEQSAVWFQDERLGNW